MKMAFFYNTESENLNRNVGNGFKIPINLDKLDMYEHRNSANEYNEINTAIIKKENKELDIHVKEELLMNLNKNHDNKKELETNTIKEEENEEETTEIANEEQSDPAQDMRNLELYSDHEFKQELVIGPVVLQLQTKPKESIEDTIEEFLKDTVTRVNISDTIEELLKGTVTRVDSHTCKVDNKRLTRGNSVLQSYCCSMCSKTYETVELLKEHLTVHKNGNINKYLLDRHHYNSNRGAYTCHICVKQYKKAVSLTCHYRTYHPDEIIKYSCHVCDIKFFDLPCLISHFSTKHQKEFICDICGISMTRKHSLICHIVGHDKIKRFMCNICNKEFARKVYLQKHEKVHKSTGIIKCEKCGKKLKSYISNYRKHMLYYCVMNENKMKKPNTHINKPQPVTCDMCKKQYSTKDTLIEHIETKHYNIKYPCKFCEKIYATRQGFQRHYLIHKNYKRNILFKRPWNMKKHKLVCSMDA